MSVYVWLCVCVCVIINERAPKCFPVRPVFPRFRGWIFRIFRPGKLIRFEGRNFIISENRIGDIRKTQLTNFYLLRWIFYNDFINLENFNIDGFLMRKTFCYYLKTPSNFAEPPEKNYWISETGLHTGGKSLGVNFGSDDDRGVKGTATFIL